MNKPIYLDQAVLDISKTLTYEFCYDYIKPNYKDKARLCYMDTDSFIINIKTEDFYEDVAYYVEKWFDISMIKMIRDHYEQEEIKKYSAYLKIIQEERL